MGTKREDVFHVLPRSRYPLLTAVATSEKREEKKRRPAAAVDEVKSSGKRGSGKRNHLAADHVDFSK